MQKDSCIQSHMQIQRTASPLFKVWSTRKKGKTMNGSIMIYQEQTFDEY